jgi:hypothetical protein
MRPVRIGKRAKKQIHRNPLFSFRLQVGELQMPNSLK